MSGNDTDEYLQELFNTMKQKERSVTKLKTVNDHLQILIKESEKIKDNNTDLDK